MKKFFLILILILGMTSFVKAEPLQHFGTAILPDGTKLVLELATTPEQWVTGLMYRRSLRENSGMLFIYDEPGAYSFWMKNCFIHLDIIWLSQDRKIVYFVENVPPCDQPDCPSYGGMQLAKYVIETTPGSVKRHKLKLGDSIALKVFDK